MSDGEADVPDKGNLEMWKHGTLENLVWDAVISPNSDRVFYAFIEGSFGPFGFPSGSGLGCMLLFSYNPARV